MRLEEVLAILRPAMPSLQARYGVTGLSLFGSIARNEASSGSDVDVLVEFAGPTTFLGFMGVKETLEDLLGSPVDLVTLASLKPRLRAAIQGELLRVA